MEDLSTRIERTPAMGVLQHVVERWRDFTLPWGPTGSVALELASGRDITTEASDLDIAISAPSRLSVEQARSLWSRVINLRPNVDVRVETPECGFSLREYASLSAIVHLCSHDALLGAIDAAREGLIEPVLVGPYAKIQSLATKQKLDISAYWARARGKALSPHSAPLARRAPVSRKTK